MGKLTLERTKMQGKRLGIQGISNSQGFLLARAASLEIVTSA
jgi:hypothetical protein